MPAISTDTPLMKQHQAIKQKYPDAILLFRVGDFYETFGEDAVLTSHILGITLTKRNNGVAASSNLAGFPHHALDTYLHKLVKAGYRVAICDQLEDPKQVKGIVKRGVTELVTPGIALHDKLLDHQSNHFLSACYLNEQTDKGGVAFVDVSTGEFFVTEGSLQYVQQIIQSILPAEMIYPKSLQKKCKELWKDQFYLYALDTWIFEEQYAYDILLQHFQTHSLKGFGIENLHDGIIAAGAILHYLKETEHPHVQHICKMQSLQQNHYLWMDAFTIRNLEILQSNTTNGNCLNNVLDCTVTSMGSRLLKRWLAFPLIDINKINERLHTTKWLIEHELVRNELVQKLKQCSDIERLSSKIILQRINPREVICIAKTLQQIIAIQSIIETSQHAYLVTVSQQLHPCEAIAQKILDTLVEQAPLVINKGGLVRNGVDTTLDEIRGILLDSKNYVQSILQKEIEATGITSLKINFNQVFGYFLEVTHIHKNKVPLTWIRKQTLANAERYITPELKEYEEKILGAEERSIALEMQIYQQLIEDLKAYITPLQSNGQRIAILDCLLCFAEVAMKNNYHLPVLSDSLELSLKESRHPIIEKNLPPHENYIPNDICFNEDQQIILLTGPNMSGKSALLRQTALIVLMAHIGSFVPAQEANIPLTDKIFTRVGANDNLNSGESTFMVEMNETACIVNNLSKRSLILLDEIGRGTSTYDGISIAWSIVEYLHQSPHQPKTFFATHYHELHELENKLSRVKNFHVANKEINKKIVFLRKMLPGDSKHSFGIQVAQMAGMPSVLIERAMFLLHELESKHVENKKIEQTIQSIDSSKPIQLSIFDTYTEAFQQIRKMLADIDINRLTPVEALMKLNEIKLLIK